MFSFEDIDNVRGISVYEIADRPMPINCMLWIGYETVRVFYLRN